MKTTTDWTGGLSFKMTNPTGNELKMDARKEIGGGGDGVSPMEAVLGGLAGCMGMDIVTILRPYKDRIQSLTFESDAQRQEEKPNYFTNIHLTVKVEGDLPESRIWRAIRLSDETYCSVANSLKAHITYSVMLNGENIPADEDDE